MIETENNPGRFLRRAAVEALTGLPRSTLYQYIAEGRFPPPAARISTRVVVWSEAAVLRWMVDKIAEEAA